MSEVTEVWADTGQVVERPMTAEERAQREADEAAFAAAAQAAVAAEALKASARQKIAETSGLTPEELAALGF